MSDAPDTSPYVIIPADTLVRLGKQTISVPLAKLHQAPWTTRQCLHAWRGVERRTAPRFVFVGRESPIKI
jgi:hypothetical protein